MTSNDYIKAMEEKSARKEAVEKDKDLKRKEAELTKERQAEEKVQKEAAKLRRLQEARAKRAFADKWSAKVVAQAGKELHQLIKSGVPPIPGAYMKKFLTFCLEICRRNQSIAMARMKARREGRPVDPTLTTVPPSWVHQPDPRFIMEDQMELELEVL